MALPLLILLAAGLVLGLQSARLGRRWSDGRPAGADIGAGLKRLPRAYLGTMHDVMGREPLVARMHALVAGGTLAAILFTARCRR